ncbi:hypothetical protein AB0I28_32365 [Phytomonospora sp. NPDC050363]|uniref:hypothetical protein n=1 Tax=Phytomonospora sp. NPDC050363 TaxID=3155642 RepID=UPI003401CBEE
MAEVVQGVQGTDPHRRLCVAQMLDGLEEQLLRAFLDRVGLRRGGVAFGLFEAAFGVGDLVGLGIQLSLVFGLGQDVALLSQALAVKERPERDQSAGAEPDGGRSAQRLEAHTLGR